MKIMATTTTTITTGSMFGSTMSGFRVMLFWKLGYGAAAVGTYRNQSSISETILESESRISKYLFKEKLPSLEMTLKRQKVPVLSREWNLIRHTEPLKVDLVSDILTPEKTLRLEHGLERVLFNPGVHILKDPRTGLYNFDPYLRKIVQPQNFNFDMLPGYKKPSQDSRLIDLARAHGKRFVGASSSLVGMLSQMYFLISNMKPINTTTLSHDYLHQLKTFTRLSRGPFSVIISPKDNGSRYMIDPDHRENSHSEEQEENILMDLGKSMEAMLTLPEQKFIRMLKSVSDNDAITVGHDPSIVPHDVFHYSIIDDFFVRSQLDCHHPSLPKKTFDLKTRATLAIRYDIARYRERLDYSLDRRFGLLQSYERELYDMMRAAMLKYNFQVRLGHMDGIFVTYHNTAEIFGFEYVPREDMDKSLFGGMNYGNEAYRLCFKLLNHVLNSVVEHYPSDPVRLLVRVNEDQPGKMEMYIERLKWDPSNKDMVLASTSGTPDVAKYDLTTFSSLKGFKIDGFEIPSDQVNQWELHFRVDKDTRDPSQGILEYDQVLSRMQDLRRSHPKYVDKIMQQLPNNSGSTSSSSHDKSSIVFLTKTTNSFEEVSTKTTTTIPQKTPELRGNSDPAKLSRSPTSSAERHQLDSNEVYRSIPNELLSLKPQELKHLATHLGMSNPSRDPNTLILEIHSKLLDSAKKITS